MRREFNMIAVWSSDRLGRSLKHLVEVLEITEEIRELILSGASSIEIKRKGIEEGMLSLRRSGLVKIKEGVTSIEEVVRETVL